MAIALVSGIFTSTGQSDWVVIKGPFNISIQGGRGTVKLEKSYDGGATAFDVSKNADGDVASWVLTDGQEVTPQGEEPENGVSYRLNCTSYTSGNIPYRISQ